MRIRKGVSRILRVVAKQWLWVHTTVLRIICPSVEKELIESPVKILVPEAKAANAPQYPCSLLLFRSQLDSISQSPLQLGVTIDWIWVNGIWTVLVPRSPFHSFPIHSLISKDSKDQGEARATIWKEPGSLNDCVFNGPWHAQEINFYFIYWASWVPLFQEAALYK